MRNGNRLTAASLMVGDWYKNIEFDECRQWCVNDYIETNTDYCEPIRITQDIIEKNDLRYRHFCNAYGEWVDIIIESHNTWFLLNISSSVDDACDWTIYDMPIFYVHELQNILRFVDLEDIANNLTI